MSFQRTVQDLVLRRSRARSATERLKKQTDLAARRERQSDQKEEEEEDDDDAVKLRLGEKTARIVLISGFESFNVKLYRKVSKDLRRKFPGLKLVVFRWEGIHVHIGLAF